MNFDLNLKHYKKINLKWSTDLNVNCETINILEENKGKSLHDLELGKEFLDMTPKHDPRKKNMINGTSSKLKMCAL